MNDCNDHACTGDRPPTHLYTRRAMPVHLTPSAAAFALAPFSLTFLAVAFFAWQKLFPLLSGGGPLATKGSTIPDSPTSRRTFSLSRSRIRTCVRFAWDRAAAITFSTTIALSALLAELIFCEITDVFEPAARKLALEATLSVLLVCLVVITPALEIHSITTATGFRDDSKAKFVLATLIDILGLGIWLLAFWAIGQAVLGSSHVHQDEPSRWSLHTAWFKMEHQGHGLSEGSLERIGIIGISLMASLAGFAAVSSIWQSFGAKLRKVTDTDITRKQAGLEATSDLLAIKESRLRALERKVAYAPPQKQLSLVTRLVGSLRPDADNQELRSLRLEIDGLTTMQASLSNSLNLLRARRATQQQASTAIGRLCITTSYVFSVYCLYRISATSIATFRRWWHPHATFASTDPINNALALIAKLWDPTLDRAAWSRQISFLLSGLMLLASFNAVLQTVLLFSRFTPARLLASAQQNLALLASQICATYVVSSALLLRSNLPREMGSVIEGALGAPLDIGFVERWFEGWFLGTCALTALGIFVSRKVVGRADFDDEYEDDVEAGKRMS